MEISLYSETVFSSTDIRVITGDIKVLSAMDISLITLLAKDGNIRSSILIGFADRIELSESELTDSLK